MEKDRTRDTLPVDELITTTFCKIHSIKSRIEQIALNKFPSENPEVLLDLMRTICDELRDSLLALKRDIPETEGQVKLAAIWLCRNVAYHLRYIEGASVDKTPWSMIRSFEQFVRKIYPEAVLILRPQWSYNYSIIQEIISYYRRGLNQFLTKDALSRLFDKWGKRKIFILSFPGFERKNILLHANFGHEIGHPLAKEFIENENKDYILEIGKEVEEKFVADLDKFDEPNRSQKKQEIVDIIVEIRNRGLEEIVSDLAGVNIFGLAAIFSLDEIMGIFENIDNVSSRPDYYPPWRTRMRFVLEYLEEMKINDVLSDSEKCCERNEVYKSILSASKQKMSYLKTLISDNKDWKEIEKNENNKIAYESVKKTVPKVNDFLKGKLADKMFPFDKDTMKQILSLCERLYYKIPPNAVETIDENEVPYKADNADIRTVINAGWFYKITYLPSVFIHENQDDYLKEVETLNRLILKAIELSDMYESYKAWEKNK